MDGQLSARRGRLRLEILEDRLAPSISPVFDDLPVPDVATVNKSANRTAPVVGVAADGSYVVAWQFTDTVHHDTDIFARRFNSDGTAKGAAFAVANSAIGETQPALAVAADGSFVIAYTKVVAAGAGTTHSVFFQTFDAAGNRKVGETEAPSHVALTAPGLINPNVLDDFSPDVAVSSSTGQFVIVWVQQTGPNNRDVFARSFGADGKALVFNDVGVGTTAGDEFNPHVAIKPSAPNDFAGTLIPVISYTLDSGNGVQKVYFRRYASGLTPLDIGPTGIPVSGPDTSAREDQSALVMDVSGNLLVAWTAAPPGGLSQVLFRQFNRQGGSPNFSPLPVDGNGLSQSAPSVALNADGRFLVAYQGAAADGSKPAQSYFREFNAALQPAGASRPVSSKSVASNVAPRLGSSGSGLFVIVTDDLTGAHPDAVARTFAYLTSRVGTVRATNTGQAQFSLDTNGDGKFDAGDSVFTFGFFSDQFVIGDWNGTGFDKVGVVRPFGAAAIFSLDTNGDGKFNAGDQVFIFGRATDQFLVGDWNGDGRSKIGVVRPNGSTAQFSLDTNGDGKFDAGDSVFNFGLPSDHFVIGDWNGDGRAKIGVVRPDANGNLVWSLDTNGNGVFDAGDMVVTFGKAADIPLVGDWTGDGKSKIGVVRDNAFQGMATFLLDTNNNGVLDAGDATFNFGRPTDKFVVGKWRRTAN